MPTRQHHKLQFGYTITSWYVLCNVAISPTRRLKMRRSTPNIHAIRLYSVLVSIYVLKVSGWIQRSACGSSRAKTPVSSTPFEMDYYDADGNDGISQVPLARPQETKLILGINKYSHDTSLCAADLETGEVLFALSKERLSRKKHDAGNILSLVESCLDALDLDLDSVERVVLNNHHHRILPLEENHSHLVWETGLKINGGVEEGYEEDENLLPEAEKIEISHHLAHCYSVASQAPFESGVSPHVPWQSLLRLLCLTNSCFTDCVCDGWYGRVVQDHAGRCTHQRFLLR